MPNTISDALGWRRAYTFVSIVFTAGYNVGRRSDSTLGLPDSIRVDYQLKTAISMFSLFVRTAIEFVKYHGTSTDMLKELKYLPFLLFRLTTATSMQGIALELNSET